MNIKGTCISLTKDECGPIYVYQTKNNRILSFDGEIYQSCMKLNNVNGLNLGYTQAMMVGLLFVPHLKTATLLGLGAGSIAKYLLSNYPILTLHAVESRQAVADIAIKYFQLPQTKRCILHINDAIDYVSHPQVKSDIIFSDLYSSTGMELQQIQTTYLQDCKNALTDQGVLILNICHAQLELQQKLNALLDTEFKHRILSFTVDGGNTILFAFKNTIMPLTTTILNKKLQSLPENITHTIEHYAKLLLEK